MRAQIFTPALVMLIFGFSGVAFSAQELKVPEECEALKVWESTRDQRIEQEFQRRGIRNEVEKQFWRSDVEQVIDERIQTLRELCAKKKS
ncbi:MAG TPA: hypothetical protein VLA17_01445 [Candidatus Limnocylindria bacterium]|nr:hypothetical protein [Candidatus Limnocylindria bacterium]